MQVLHNCDPGFQQTGHAMVPYSFNIKPATAVAEVLIKYGAKVNLELEPSPTIKILIPRGMKKIYKKKINNLCPILLLTCFRNEVTSISYIAGERSE